MFLLRCLCILGKEKRLYIEKPPDNKITQRFICAKAAASQSYPLYAAITSLYSVSASSTEGK